MPADALIMSESPHAFDITATSPDYQTIVSYASENVLQSGWLIGENLIKGKAAMVSVNVGSNGGQVVVFGFRPTYRGWTEGTYKLLFDCLR
jgi:hypothetical protein